MADRGEIASCLLFKRIIMYQAVCCLGSGRECAPPEFQCDAPSARKTGCSGPLPVELGKSNGTTDSHLDKDCSRHIAWNVKEKNLLQKTLPPPRMYEPILPASFSVSNVTTVARANCTDSLCWCGRFFIRGSSYINTRVVKWP